MNAEPRQNDLNGASQRAPSPLVRGYYLLRYHRFGQLVRRARNLLRNRWLRRFGAPRYLNAQAAVPDLRDNPALAGILSDKLADRRSRGASQVAAEVAEGQYRFLNQTVSFSDKIDWRLSSHPKLDALWRFHLHYQEYLLDLVATDSEDATIDHIQLGWEIVVDWIENNQPSDGRVFSDAWHPFCISRRVPVWILLWTASPPEEKLREQILRSMTGQANFLADHLETDLGGNHLLENLRALGMVGCFLTDPEAQRWLEIVGRILPGELKQQITAHGEHFERSPMYHLHMLEAVLDLRDSANDIDDTISSSATTTATKMGGFLRFILHPDQNIPLFGDSLLNEAPSPAHLLERIGSSLDAQEVPELVNQRQAARTGGYWTFRDKEDFLILDAASACPDHLPAHAHADLLNLEMSLSGKRVFVDSGVYNYTAGPMRQYCRGTLAHNVLQIDGVDQFDIWSRFRMGYRGRPQITMKGQLRGFEWVRATHNGFRRVGVPEVGRWVACRPNGPWFCIDWAEGSGSHEHTQRLHLHPDIGMTQLEDCVFALNVGEQQFELLTLGGAVARLEEGWYCPAFGERRRNQVVTWGGRFDLPMPLGWALKWPGQQGRVSLGTNGDGQPLLAWDENGSRIEWQPCGDQARL